MLLLNKKVKSILKAAEKPNSTNRVLEGVNIVEREGGNYKAVCTNGRILLEYSGKALPAEEFPSVSGTENAGSAINCNIPANFLEGEFKKLKKSTLPIVADNVALAQNAETVNVVSTNLDTTSNNSVRIIDQPFPPYEQLFPTSEPVIRLTLSASYLKTMCEAFIENAGKGELHPDAIEIEIFGAKKPVMIRERGIEKHLTGLIMPIKSPTDLFPANQKTERE